MQLVAAYKNTIAYFYAYSQHLFCNYFLKFALSRKIAQNRAMIEITLPFPPSTNSLFGGGSKQRRFKSKKYKEWEKSCPALPDQKIDVPVSITLIYYLPTKRETDLDNRVKAVLDRLVLSNVIVDDNYKIVQRIIVQFGGIEKDNPRVEVRVVQID